MNLNGKKTYLFLASAAATVALGVAARHGLDLTSLDPQVQQDLTALLGGLLLTGAAWARSKVASVVIDQQAIDTPMSTDAPR